MASTILLPCIETAKAYRGDCLPCDNLILRFFCSGGAFRNRHRQMAGLLWIQTANRLAVPDMWNDYGNISFRSGENLTGFLYSAGMCFVMFCDGYRCVAGIYHSSFRDLFSLSKSFFFGSKGSVRNCCRDNYNCIRLGGDISSRNSSGRKLIPPVSNIRY